MNDPSVTFLVRGTPASQGSMTASWTIAGAGRPKTGNVRVEDIRAFVRPDSAAKLKRWRTAVSQAAARAMDGRMPLTGPVGVRVTFFWPRPASHTREQRRNPWYHPKGRDDIEKLVRSCFDAMTDAAVWEDDGLVAFLESSSIYGDEAGALIRVYRLLSEEGQT